MLLTADSCLQVLTGLAACSEVATTAGVSAAAAASPTVLAHACLVVSTPAAAVTPAVASNITAAVPNAAAADVALFAQDPHLCCPNGVCLSACPIASDVVEGCWCRGKGHPVRALLKASVQPALS